MKTPKKSDKKPSAKKTNTPDAKKSISKSADIKPKKRFIDDDDDEFDEPLDDLGGLDEYEDIDDDDEY